MATQERAAVLVIRAWVEGSRLRARIVQTRDIESVKTVESAAGSAEEVVKAVEEWLRSLGGET
jgi:hypothetical protein